MPNKPKSSRSSKPRSKPGSRATPPDSYAAPSAIHKEVKCLILIALGILLALSVFVTDTIGFIGRLFATLLFGLLGFGAFVLPIAIVAIAIFILINRQMRLPFTLVIVLYGLILSMLHIINSHDFGD